jgi:hypothetical protein
MRLFAEGPPSGGADGQPTAAPGARSAPDDDLDVAVEGQQEPQQPLEREVPEMAAQQARDIRLEQPDQPGSREEEALFVGWGVVALGPLPGAGFFPSLRRASMRVEGPD